MDVPSIQSPTVVFLPMLDDSGPSSLISTSVEVMIIVKGSEKSRALSEEELLRLCMKRSSLPAAAS
jgi:hypothetical protein